jgi:hypothetical protein
VYRGTLGELAERAQRDGDMARGEITLVVAGAPPWEQGDAQLLSRALPLLLKDLTPSRAAAIGAQLAGVPRAQAYEQALALSRDKAADSE